MNSRKIRNLLVLAAFSCMAVLINCGGSSSNTGFKVRAQNFAFGFDGSLLFVGDTSVQAFWLFDNGAAQGQTKFFGPALCVGGPCNVSDGRVPATWRIIPQNGACIQFLAPLDRNVTAGSTQVAKCLVSAFASFAASPDSIDLLNPPATVTVTGSGISGGYGMPVIQYYDQYSGVLVASTTASNIAADGSWLQASTPDLSSVYTGAYNIVISNVAADGTLELLGAAPISAWNRDPAVCCDPPPDPPPCGENRECTIN
ncbi:MAG: hypothetical protein ABI923_08205 [bacterium]